MLFYEKIQYFTENPLDPHALMQYVFRYLMPRIKKGNPLGRLLLNPKSNPE